MFDVTLSYVVHQGVRSAVVCLFGFRAWLLRHTPDVVPIPQRKEALCFILAPCFCFLVMLLECRLR